jgi:phosphoenolpyruvate carboxykinase (ATP)
VGKRISIRHTRALLNAALSGYLLKVQYKKDPVFGFDVPVECEGVPSQILDPANTWPSRDEYFHKYDALAARFIENFKLMMAECPEHILEAGPKRLTPVAVR